jgi:hypothetical protein
MPDAAPSLGRFRFVTPSRAQYRGMDLKKPLVLLAVIGSLVACGDNTDVQRGETNCDSSSTDANNAHDASCQETGSNDHAG